MTDKVNNPSESLPEDEIELQEPVEQIENKKTITFSQIWNKILHFGLGEPAVRIGTAVASLVLIALVVWVMSKFFLKAEKTSALPTPPSSSLVITPDVPLSENLNPVLASSFSVFRLAQLHTILPPKPRSTVTEYTIVEGDTLFGIADKFGLKPESLLWSNQHILGNNPHNIYPGITILIPPFDGAIYEWAEGSGLNGVAKFYNVSPDDIVDWPYNQLDRATLGDYSFPNIPVGKLLFIPHGYGEFSDWLEQYTREKPATSSITGSACGVITAGYIGSGTFIWPSTETWISGFEYSPSTNHRGIDIAGQIGNIIYAVDDGVVVYSNWNTNGYGNLIVVDHGNGWQSVYAHLDSFLKYCGDNVSQGEQIATLGNTGNSTGPHLHFELRSETYGAVNPHDFLQLP
jgi:murein DD-endopeptidase MepM/ murein hydrolase activator NlpD